MPHGDGHAATDESRNPDPGPWHGVVRIGRGGVYAIENRMSVPVAGTLLVESQATRHAALDGDARTPDATIRVEVVLDESRTLTVGGDFPEPPPE